MQDTKLFETILGITKPWHVARVELNTDEERVDLWLEHEPTPWLPRRRAKRAPQAQLVPTRRGPRQLQVRDIRARDEQHECDDKQDRQQRAPIDATQLGDARADGCERE
jgi:hypothetical protein